MQKYRMLREWVAAELPDVELVAPASATDDELALAHTSDYIARVSEGRLTAAEEREIGFPWSPAMVERSRRSVGATIGAARAALSEGIAVNLAGGTHHAYADKGSGFCVFNDVAVTARLMQHEGRARRVAIVDLDVHQGNGTANILADCPDTFTLSVHAAKNFPFRKEASDLDVGLADGTEDEEYLEAVRAALAELDRRFSPDLAIFLAGADPWQGDRLGRLALSIEGLAQRDHEVFAWASRLGIPMAVTMAGGYGQRVEDTAMLHAQTVGAAARWAAADRGRTGSSGPAER